MKSILLTTILFLGILVTPVKAQTLKMGYTNVEYILAFMPEAQTVQTELTEYENQLVAEIQTKQAELQQKVTEYQQGSAMMVDAVRAEREDEIRRLDASLQQFQANAEGLLQAKQLELLQPLYNTIQTAIDEVAAEGGYLVVFRSESLLYADESMLEEISDQVFAKLGIELPAETPAPVDQ
ncbi:MAG: OmpH family outer membrane protein [Balneolales bacterium]|nr:OmpH family outer membrane protein [Balneolales bacterium]